MADQPHGTLIETARTIGGAVGSVVSALTGGSKNAGDKGSGKPARANLWQAEYVGSGTFIIHKPKRTARKRRQQALKGTRPGMRK